MENGYRLIDANALRCEIDGCSFESGYDCGKVLIMIAEAPTVDAVEVVHGRWKFHKGHFNDFAECSNCGDFHGKEIAMAMNYCPNCGAKMDGGNEDG